ncbi:MAG: NAD-dependent epimerase/dehydratase family protein [Gemmatimonadota bacterium]
MLVTGATGWIGRTLVARLLDEPWAVVRAAVRGNGQLTGVEVVDMGDLSLRPDWRMALRGIDVVVHLAACVHRSEKEPSGNLAFELINSAVTADLADRAAATGVRRLVFVSSAKVYGESGVFNEGDPPAPRGPYAVSKANAELQLRLVSSRTGLEVVIVRPPLVHGPGAKANLGVLTRAIRRGIPLPLAGIANRRSMVGVDNLVDFLVRCISDPRAAGWTFSVSDGEAVSTPRLIELIAAGLNVRARLFRAPPQLMRAAARILHREDDLRRLTDDFEIRGERASEVLNWRPGVTLAGGLRRAARAVDGAARLSAESGVQQADQAW